MLYKVLKPICLQGRRYVQGETVEEAVINQKRLWSLIHSGYIAAVKTGETVYTQEELEEIVDEEVQAAIKAVDSSAYEGTILVPIRNKENAECMSLPMKPEEIVAAIQLLQLNANEGSKAIEEIQEENVLILIHALDSRKIIKEAAKKQADILNAKETVKGNTDNSNEELDNNEVTNQNQQDGDV